jgi:hypothetical protein
LRRSRNSICASGNHINSTLPAAAIATRRQRFSDNIKDQTMGKFLEQGRLDMTRHERKTRLVGPWRNIHGAIWLIGLAILFWKGWWWPGILILTDL